MNMPIAANGGTARPVWGGGDHYPYERLTPETVANIQRLRDKQMREVRAEVSRLRNDLYFTQQRLNRILSIFEASGISEEVLLATDTIFGGIDNGKR